MGLLFKYYGQDLYSYQWNASQLSIGLGSYAGPDAIILSIGSGKNGGFFKVGQIRVNWYPQHKPQATITFCFLCIFYFWCFLRFETFFTLYNFPQTLSFPLASLSLQFSTSNIPQVAMKGLNYVIRSMLCLLPHKVKETRHKPRNKAVSFHCNWLNSQNSNGMFIVNIITTWNENEKH